MATRQSVSTNVETRLERGSVPCAAMIRRLSEDWVRCLKRLTRDSPEAGVARIAGVVALMEARDSPYFCRERLRRRCLGAFLAFGWARCYNAARSIGRPVLGDMPLTTQHGMGDYGNAELSRYETRPSVRLR
jgi:hypothetical protein